MKEAEARVKASRIVKDAWDRAPHLTLEDVLRDKITAALMEQPLVWPTDDEVYLAYEQSDADPGLDPWVKACKWMREFVEQTK